MRLTKPQSAIYWAVRRARRAVLLTGTVVLALRGRTRDHGVEAAPATT